MMFAACLGAANPAAMAQAKAASPAPEPAWVTRSNQYTQMLLDVQLKYSPEGGSRQGLAKYDALITDPTRAAEMAQRRELEGVLATLSKDEKKEKDENVREDLEILQKTFNLQFREEDYQLAHKVPFINASAAVYAGLQSLLDDQVPAERRPAAVIRLRKYAGVEPGTKPFTDLLKQRVMEQMAKPGVVYPFVGEIETELGRNKNYVDGLQKLFQTYKLTGWQEPFAKLRQELADYDTWVRATVLPKARTDVKLAPEEYALALESYGVDIPPAQLAATGAPGVHGNPGGDGAAGRAGGEGTRVEVDRLPRRDPRVEEAADYGRGDSAVLQGAAEGDRRHHCGEQAGDAAQPAGDYSPGDGRGDGAGAGAAHGSAAAAAQHRTEGRVCTAADGSDHRGQPGGEVRRLQLRCGVVERGGARGAAGTRAAVRLDGGARSEQLARAMFAFNSTNVEGWGLYAEWMMQPYEPVDGKLMTLQLRLLRAARAFLDPGLQSGKVTPADAYKVLENDVVLSHAFATEEVERFTYRAPGQANSYLYGLNQLLQLRKDTEAALGKKFDQKKYHDFLLAQGLLPADLLRKAVMEEFVPREKK